MPFAGSQMLRRQRSISRTWSRASLLRQMTRPNTSSRLALGMTGLFGGVNRHDAAGKWLGCDILKSAGLKQIAHRTTTGKFFDRSTEILVGFFFTRNDCGNER